MMRSMEFWTRLSGITILAALAGCASDPVRPDERTPTRISLEVGTAELASFGDSVQVRPIVYDQNGSPITDATVEWSLSSDGVVDVVGPGVFRARTDGEVTVRAQVRIAGTGVRPAGYWTEPLAASANLRVRQRPARLLIAPVDTFFSVIDGTRRLSVTATDARGNLMRTLPQPVEFRSANGDVVSVDASGVVRSRRLGNARVTAQVAALQAGVTFVVEPRLSHTSCMTVIVRRRTSQQCISNGFTVRAPAEAR